METKLNRISEIAGKEGKCTFNNLIHHLNVENLRECFYRLKKKKASGVDGVSFREYEKNLEANLENLVARLKARSYRPQPLLRVYIEKDGGKGKQRPLGIPATEDKIIQMGITRLLGAIYENDFRDSSHGFRPKRNCHTALRRVNQITMHNPVHYVIDADIKGFFDNMSHEWMMRFLGDRIQDKRFLHLIARFLKSGILEAGKYKKTEQGVPQGGVLSPMLSNIYLHYVLDLWIERKVRKETTGYVGFVRYADDFLICVEHQADSERILRELRDRLKKFGLALSEEKTKIVIFGRKAKDNAERTGGKPGTFDFLGFTHTNAKTRKGGYKIGRRTTRKNFNQKIKAINEWLKAVRNVAKPKVWWKILCAKMRGHFQYYGVSENADSLEKYRRKVVWLVLKWLNRRSQKRSMNWIQFYEYLKRHELPKYRIVHKLY